MNNKDFLKSKEMKNILSQKRSFFSLPEGFNEYLGIILAVAFSFIGTYLFLPWHGIISTIPFVIICAFICTFLKTNELLKEALFFITPFAVSLLLGENVKSALVLGILCGIFYILAYVTVSSFKKKQISFKIVAAFLLVLSLGVHCFANSTPWDVHKSKNAILNYVKESYSGEPLYASEVKFNSFDRTYSLSLVPQHDASIGLSVVLKDGKIIKDDYIKYTEKYNMLAGAGRITYVIRKMYPELKFKVESERIVGYPFMTSATVQPKADYSRFMDFSVYFTSYNGAKEFSELAEECYRALITSGFYCRTITFYGGIGTRYVAKISVPFGSLTGNLENFVEPYDSNIFLYSSLK